MVLDRQTGRQVFGCSESPCRTVQAIMAAIGQGEARLEPSVRVSGCQGVRVSVCGYGGLG